MGFIWKKLSLYQFLESSKIVEYVIVIVEYVIYRLMVMLKPHWKAHTEWLYF
jgi:hypothetical protein